MNKETIKNSEHVAIPVNRLDALKHEIRTPITSVLLNVQLIEKKIEMNIPIPKEEMLDFLKRIEIQIKKTNKVLEQEIEVISYIP